MSRYNQSFASSSSRGASIDADGFSFISQQLGAYHKDPINVLLHFVTTPIGLVGALSLIRNVTNTTSTLVGLCFLYLMSLLPISDLHQGEFFGTFVLLELLLAKR